MHDGNIVARRACLAALAAVAALAPATCAPSQEPAGAEWELRALGVPEGARRDALRELPKRRPVTLAIVGHGGVSASQLAARLNDRNTLQYRDGADDPNASTHDTGMAQVILDITDALGVQVRMLVYQPGQPFRDVAEAMRKAGAEADIVAFYQSFWGPDVTHINAALRETTGCLFISPYVEYAGNPTSACPQAHSAKPWAEGLAHFVTVAPCPQKAPGQVLTPSTREGDTEVVNFIAPSFFASGAGGTCPSAAVAAAVAAFIVAARDEKPEAPEIAAIMRGAVTDDAEVLQERLGWEPGEVEALLGKIDSLAAPGEAHRRTLDAAGVLDLWAAYEYITE